MSLDSRDDCDHGFEHLADPSRWVCVICGVDFDDLEALEDEDDYWAALATLEPREDLQLIATAVLSPAGTAALGDPGSVTFGSWWP